MSGVPRVSENAEPTERAMAVDETISALESLLNVKFCISSAGDGGVIVDGFVLRKRGIVMRADDKFVESGVN